jgi:hypothetical protein
MGYFPNDKKNGEPPMYEFTGEFSQNGFSHSVHPSCLLFNSSWDWLMPVVEKIESEFCSSNIHYYSAGMMKQEYVVEFLGYNIDYDNSQYDKSKIKAVYKAVIKFIKWYNKNKKL